MGWAIEFWPLQGPRAMLGSLLLKKTSEVFIEPAKS